MPDDNEPSKAEKERMVEPGMLLGLMAFVAILGFVSVYMAAGLISAEVELARLEGRELSMPAMMYARLANWAYIGPGVMLVLVVLISASGTKRQRTAIALIAAGLVFSLLWHIGAHSVFA